MVHMLCHERRAPVGRFCYHILHGHYRTESASLRIPWSQVGPEMNDRLRCMLETAYLEGPKQRCSVCNCR